MDNQLEKLLPTLTEVAEDQFFDKIGKLDVHPSIQGNYPYWSRWEMRDRVLVGVTVSHAYISTKTYYLRHDS